VGVLWIAAVRYRRLLWAAVGVGVVGAVTTLLVLPDGVVSTALSSSSFAERAGTWSGAMARVLAAPLGQGLGATGAAAARIAAATGDIAPIEQPDNYYVKILIELGPIGLWLFLLLLVSALVWSTRLARRLPGRDGALALGVSASVASVAASSLVATYLEIFPLDLYFWLLLGAVACAAAQSGSDPVRPLDVPVETGARP
jgi:hypothetical protein